MLRYLPLLVFLLAPLAIAAPIPKENDAARMTRIYGVKSDPTETATFNMLGDKLRITTPAWADLATMPRNARGLVIDRTRSLPDFGPRWTPRVWQELPGDFTLVVRVGFPGANNKPPQESYGRGAGLVIWADSGDHFALVRHAKTQPLASEFVQTLYRYPGSYRTGGNSLNLDAGDPLFLRLVRDEQIVTAAYSKDGKTWESFSPDGVEWKKPVNVGVYVKNLSDAPFEAVFDEYKLTVPKK